MTTNGSPLVSIITPTLNQAGFIDDAIRSVRAQSYQQIEHIVVDGGSSDGTLEILHGLEGPSRFRWRSEPDRGMYDAIGKGLRQATGEVFAYLNSDDVYPPWAVEVAVAKLVASPEVDVVFGDGLTIDESNGRQRLSFTPPFNGRRLAFTGSLVQPAVFWRRRAFEEAGGFDADLRYVGDLEYWLRLGRHARFARVNEVLAIERVHAGALSQASSKPMHAEEVLVRYRHHQAAGWRRLAATLLARGRAAWWRRRLGVAFLASVRGSDPGRGWQHFLADGDVKIDPGRVVLAFVPRLGAGFAWNSVVSRRPWFSQTERVEEQPSR